MQNIPALLRLIKINPEHKPYIEFALDEHISRGVIIGIIEEGLKDSIKFWEHEASILNGSEYKVKYLGYSEEKKNKLRLLVEEGLPNYVKNLA